MRHQLKPKTPSVRARMSYILRTDRYGVNQTRAAELVAAGVANLPSWASGPADFWSAVDGFERANGRLCLELELGLPRELPRDRQVAAVGDYIDRLTAEAGRFPITWAIHDSGDGNPHVHLMLQERALSAIDRSGPKAHFKRADKKRPERGGVEKSRWWHSKERVFWSRALWADACNQQLLAAGQAPRFDARRKSERLDEALRAGDLRAAAALCTQTERHEGVKVAAARKKLEGGWVESADLPEQVMQIINGNDQARTFNCWLRDWARTASDKELQLFLADHLHELKQRLEAESPSGHIQTRAAWLLHEHAQALEEDRARSVATAQQAGELELLTAAQIEAAERAAIAGELADLIDLEQAHSAALIDDQQREAAPMQAVEQARARIEQQTAELREQLPEARQALAEAADRAAELRSMAEPPACQQAIAQRQQVAQLAAEAQRQTAAAAQWRQAHPARAWIADRLGIEPAADRAAREARDAARTAHRAYDARDTKARAVAWQQTRTELAGIEQRLPELREQQRQIEEELLQHAGPEALRKATEQQLARAQRAEQHMQPHDLEHAQERRQELADRLHQGGTPADQVQLYRDAEQHGKEAERLGQDGAQVRSITCLRIAREQLAEARQALKDAPEPELAGQLAEADAQAREWQMDPRQRGSVDDCERLLEQSGELRDRAQEAAQQELEQRAGQHLGRMEGWEQIEQQRQAEARQELERLRDRPAPGEDGPRRSGPRFSGPR